MGDILDVNKDKLTNEQRQELAASVKASIDKHHNAVEMEQAAAARGHNIQRRGHRYPGDQSLGYGDFGMFGFNSGVSNPRLLGPFADSWPGSYFYSGYFGGSSLHHNGLFGQSNLLGGQGSLVGLKRSTQVAHYKMAACVAAYKGFGLAKNVIDMMANFASEGLKIKHPNKTTERFLQRWAFHVDLNGRVKDILRTYYKNANVFIYRTLGTIDNSTYTKLRRSRSKIEDGMRPIADRVKIAKSEQDVDPVSDPQQTERGNTKEIPWRYTLLNPFQMELRGNKFFGKHRWVFVLDHETASSNREDPGTIDFLEETDVNLPPEFKRLSKLLSEEAEGNERNDPRVVDLDQTKLYTMHYMKDDHEDWADPMLWPVMADIFYKNKLRQMDISVCESVINSVVIFKLGNLEKGYIPDKNVMSEFSELLRTPTQSMNMVWNDAIAIEDSYPPVDRILGMQKYESVDRDILRGIGIPDTLIGGATKGNFSTDFLGVRTLLERLEEGREVVKRWLIKELDYLSKSLGLKGKPIIRFGKMSLRDEKAEKQLILNLLDRNIVSIEAVLEAFGEDFELELERMKGEQRIRDEQGLLDKHGPYVEPMTDMDLEEQMQKEQEARRREREIDKRIQKDKQQDREKKNQQGPKGRPVNTKDIKQEKKRETKPQGMAAIINYEHTRAAYVKLLNRVEKVLANQLLQATGKKTKRSLSKKEAEFLEYGMFTLSSLFSPDEKVDELTVLSALKARPVLGQNIMEVYQSMKTENMSLSDRKSAMASAIAHITCGGTNA